jgi:transcriptional regulator with XRE-family HTH domain
MNAQQLRLIREDRSLTREGLAKILGVSHGAIVNWELRGTPIPDWVERELLSNINVTLPLNELAALMAHCQAYNISPQEVLSRCIRSYIAPPAPAILPLPVAPAELKDAPPPESAMVAEDPAPYPSPPNPTPPKKLNP